MNHLQLLFKNTAVFFLCIFLSNIGAQAQEVITEKNVHFNTLQGGVFYEHDRLEQQGDVFNFSSFGASKIAYGFLGFKESKTTQFLLELSYINKEVQAEQPQVNLDPNATISKQKVFFEAEYFKSYIPKISVINNLHAGPTIFAYYTASSYEPTATNRFTMRTQSGGLGLGAKAMFIKEISKRFSLLISSGIKLIDLGVNYEFDGNPNIQVENQRTVSILDVRLFRPRANLNFGLVF